jgi:hypothetical protein
VRHLSTIIIIIQILQSTNFNENLSLKFCTYKKTTIENNLCHSLILSNVFEIMKFTSYDLKILFIYTLCYDNVDDNEFFRL